MADGVFLSPSPYMRNAMRSLSHAMSSRGTSWRACTLDAALGGRRGLDRERLGLAGAEVVLEMSSSGVPSPSSSTVFEAISRSAPTDNHADAAGAALRQPRAHGAPRHLDRLVARRMPSGFSTRTRQRGAARGVACA
jgi:hypothetical protein